MTQRITRLFTNSRSWSATPSSSEAYSDDGGKVWHWASNNTVIMLDVCRDYNIPCDPVAQEAARDAQVSAFLAEYRRRQPAQPSAEELFEARAAFGPGQEVVDVVSGRRFRT